MFIWICKYCASILNPWNTRNATCQQDGDFPLSSPSWRKRCSHTTFWEIWTIGEQQIFYHPRLPGIVTKILILPTDSDLTYSKICTIFVSGYGDDEDDDDNSNGEDDSYGDEEVKIMMKSPKNLT